MKRFVKLLALLVGISSCTQEDYELPAMQSEINSQLMSSILEINDVATWEEELNYCLKGKGRNLLLSQGLEMIEYKLQKGEVIFGREAILHKLSDDTLLPIYNDSTNINNFNLLGIAEINFKYLVDAGIFYLRKKEEFLTGYLNCELKKVMIKWSYKGKEFETECLVTDERMIYDNILSNIRYIMREDSSTVIVIPNVKIKTRTPEDDNKPNSISYINQSPSLICYTGTGKVGAIAYYYVQLIGTKYGDGTKSIDYADYQAPHQAKPGFSAVGMIEVTKDELGKNGRFSYKYAIGVGTRDITLNWDGSSFTMYGQDQGSTGGESLTANSLN